MTASKVFTLYRAPMAPRFAPAAALGLLALGVSFSTALPQARAQGVNYSFFNLDPSTINDFAPAAPYPSPITVNGLDGLVIFDLNVTIYNFSHTFPGDVGMLLVAPSGQQVLLDGRVGGSTDAVNAFVTFDDEAALTLSTPIVSGTFRPAATSVPNFSAPAPADSGNLLLSTFDGTAPNGVWNLYVQDFASADTGSIAFGYSLTSTPACRCPSPPPGRWP